MEVFPCRNCLCLPICIPPNNNYWCILKPDYQQGVASHVEYTLAKKCDLLNTYINIGTLKKRRLCAMKTRVFFSMLVGAYKG